MSQPNFDLLEAVRLLLRWWKPISIVTAVSLVASIVITDPHIMPPYYKSVAIILPSNPELTNTQNLFVQSEANFFGTKEDVNRLLGIANSAELKTYMVSKFHLFNHYEIDSAGTSYPFTKVIQELEDNYTAMKNDLGSVEITIYDQDSKLAAEMANEIVSKVDDIGRSILMNYRLKMLDVYSNKVTENEKAVKIFTDSIINIKKQYGLFGGMENLGNKVNVLSNDKTGDAQQAMERLKVLEDNKKSAVRELNNSTTQLSMFKASINKDVPTLNVLQKAYPAEKKSKPIRWLAAAASTLLGFIFSCAAVILIFRFRRFKEALKNVAPKS